MVIKEHTVNSKHRQYEFHKFCYFSSSLADLMPKVKVEPVETVEGCTHEVSLHTHFTAFTL